MAPAAQRANGSPDEGLARWAEDPLQRGSIPLGVARGWPNGAPSGQKAPLAGNKTGKQVSENPFQVFSTSGTVPFSRRKRRWDKQEATAPRKSGQSPVNGGAASVVEETRP
jgi:hypothetical protein